MGIREAWRVATKVAAGGAPDVGAAPHTGLKSPWAPRSHLERVVAADIYGADGKPLAGGISRAQAMKVPSIVKGRSLIVGTLARQPLAKFRGETKIDADAWMYRTSTAQAPRTRMLWTLDDLIFYGTSLWALERGAQGRILDAVRVPPAWWEVDEDLNVLVYGQPVKAEDVVLIEGPQDGLLEIANETIAGALAIERAWIKRVKTPVPLMELHSTESAHDLEEDEVDELLKAWESARAEGGTAYTPASIEAKVHGTTPTDLFTNGRNGVRLDVANFLGLPASLLEGSTSTASLTYSTTEGKRNELVDYSLAFWANPIEARLSQDDVVPAGQRVAFDLEYLTDPAQPAQGPVHED